MKKTIILIVSIILFLGCLEQRPIMLLNENSDLNYWDTNKNQTGLNGNKTGTFDLVTNGVIQAGYYYSTVGAGTPPFFVTSTDRVENFNADMLDGFHASDFNTGLTKTLYVGDKTLLGVCFIDVNNGLVTASDCN